MSPCGPRKVGLLAPLPLALLVDGRERVSFPGFAESTVLSGTVPGPQVPALLCRELATEMLCCVGCWGEAVRGGSAPTPIAAGALLPGPAVCWELENLQTFLKIMVIL